jgi:hypothetical protein
MLGRRTTVTVLAQAMLKNGLIKYRRGHITILDPRESRPAPANATTSSIMTIFRPRSALSL